MYQSTHASVGQNQGRMPYAQRAGSRALSRSDGRTPSISRRARERYVPHDFAPPSNPLGPRLSTLNSRLSRPGISLTEVLIAMGILTVGLLGVASIFPVASFYMQQGDVADRGSQIAQGAFNDAVARGQLDPANWWMMTPTDFEQYQMNVDGKVGTTNMAQTFSRPVLAAIDECKARWSAAVFPQRMGGIYVIDPLGVAAMTRYDTNPSADQAVARQFPANAGLLDLTGTFSESHWQPWFANSSSTNPAIWPVRRLTLRQPRIGAPATASYFIKTQPLVQASAERSFTSGDDLAIEVPTQADRPSSQRLATFKDGPDTRPLARQSRGDYSWIITAVPSDLRNLAGSNCEVSVVVFHKRPLITQPVVDQEGQRTASLDERVTRAKIVSTGLSGGEVLLEAVDSNNDGVTDDEILESAFANLRKGRWIMLSGPSPNSTSVRPQFVARWYRVLAIEDKLVSGILTNSTTQRLVSLRGPQWPWQPEPNGDLDEMDHLSNNLSTAIIPGAVAVHSKTIRLEGNSAWSMQ